MGSAFLQWPVYLLVGALSGWLAGLLGIGGGLILVPALLLLLPLAGVSADALMPMAIGSSLAAIVLTAVASTRAHASRGAVQWPLFWRLAPTVALTASGAGWLAARLGSQLLTLIFAGFVLALAVRTALTGITTGTRQRPGRAVWAGFGAVIGSLSGLVGIGGGSLTVPLLLHFGVPITEAVATSAAVGLPIALFGTLGYVAAGWSLPLPVGATGFVYWPAVLAITAASWFSAPIGAKLAHRWPAARLRKLFALFLAIVGLRLAVRALTGH
ncbi:sulfite exporter TauE/SafE family protein [Permianibacter sp. IMCC34836]|uniref:sulfite exporter TauE/SafE family protein n=1 Tax=Permianibacter fluminis TaxID=2738515 RepID=UPI001552B7CA|nr:sulfite exporter TauE/SafE family protein [Permianibacter fluminis]NQD36324.1 sulfite exporter TauE/SafE family protein [Permianibacter fluminis]